MNSTISFTPPLSSIKTSSYRTEMFFQMSRRGVGTKRMSDIAACCQLPLVSDVSNILQRYEQSSRKHQIRAVVQDWARGPSVWTARENVWQRKRDLKRETHINHHLNIHLPSCSKAVKPHSSIAEIVCVCVWEEDAFLRANSEPQECWESAPFLWLNPPRK